MESIVAKYHQYYYHAKISRIFYGPDVTRSRAMLLVIVQLATTASTFVMLELHYIMKDPF